MQTAEMSKREKLFTLRMDDEEQGRLNDLAEHYGLTVAAMLRMLVKTKHDEVGGLLEAGRKRALDNATTRHVEIDPAGPHRIAQIVAEAARRREPRWWSLMTPAELDSVLTVVDGAIASILPSRLADECSEYLGGRRIATDLDLEKALRSDYRKARADVKAATKKTKAKR